MKIHSLIATLAMNQLYEVTISSVGDGEEISIGYCTGVDLPPLSPTAAPYLLNQPPYAMSREERQSLKAKQRKAAKKPAHKGGRP